MPADSVAITTEAPAKRKPNKRRARVAIDKRYSLGRRYKALERMFTDRLGPAAADPVVAAAIEKAARLTALAEDASAKAVNCDPNIDMDTVVRLNRLADLALQRLHLDRRQTRPAGPTLREYLSAGRQEVAS